MKEEKLNLKTIKLLKIILKERNKMNKLIKNKI